MTPNEEKIPVEAQLVSVSDHAYLYVESGLGLSSSVLEQLQYDFETNMYGTLVPVFGNPPDELDGDSHITILVATFVGTSLVGATAAGYFDDANQYTDTEAYYRELGHSNEREMIYINPSSSMNPTSPTPRAFSPTNSNTSSTGDRIPTKPSGSTKAAPNTP